MFTTPVDYLKESIKLNWSTYQEAIFNFVKSRCSNIFSGSPNSIVSAGPGAAKSTTIVQATRYIPDFMACTVASFNSHIAEHLKAKVIPHQSATLNALGWRACKAYDKNIILDKFKTSSILKEIIQPDHFYKLKNSVERVISLLKANVTIPGNIDQQINEIIKFHDLDIPVIQNINFNQIVSDVYTRSANIKHILDFDDQLLHVLLYEYPLPQLDYLFVDEAQDLNKANIELCRRMVNKYFMAVGDPYQSVYQFRGSMPDAMNIVKNEFGCSELSLPICYRCPNNIIKEIQKINPNIEAPNPNPNGEGVVDGISKQEFRKTAEWGNFVLCRTTAPLVKECLKFLGMKKYAFVKGRDIGQNLVGLIDKVEMGNCSISVFNNKLDSYYSVESARLASLNREYQLSELTDQVDSLREIMPHCSDVDGIIKLIKDMIPANEEGKGIIFMSCHRAKGLETDRVFILRKDLIPHNKARTSEQLIQERNLLFISQSRAQKELYYIEKEIGEK